MSVHTVSNEDLDGWKAVFAKDGIIYETDEEYREAINNLVGFFDILIEMDQKQRTSPDSAEKDDGEKYVFDKDGNKVIL